MRVAIDFSINSTAIVVDDSGVRRHLVVLPELGKGAKFKAHRILEPCVDFVEYGALARSDSYSDREADKLRDAQRMSAAIVDSLSGMGEPELVTFEGFSFASKGASFIDLIVFNSFAKKAVMDAFRCKVAVVAPGTVKLRYAGSGVARKPEMYDAFLRRSDGVIRSAMYDAVGDYHPDMKVPKPVDDVVDAIAIADIVAGLCPAPDKKKRR